MLNEHFGLSLLTSSGRTGSWGRLHENIGCEASLKLLFAACCYMNVYEVRLRVVVVKGRTGSLAGRKIFLGVFRLYSSLRLYAAF